MNIYSNVSSLPQEVCLDLNVEVYDNSKIYGGIVVDHFSDRIVNETV